MLNAADPAASRIQMRAFLRELFGRHLNIPPVSLNEEDSFFSLGLTSLIHQQVIIDLTRAYGELSSTVLFEYPNIALLAEHLAVRASAAAAQRPLAAEDSR